MTAHLTVLETLADEDKQSVVELLEKMLEEAKNGRSQAVAIAVVRPDGSMNSAWSATSNIGPVIGAISLLQYRLIHDLEDELG